MEVRRLLVFLAFLVLNIKYACSSGPVDDLGENKQPSGQGGTNEHGYKALENEEADEGQGDLEGGEEGVTEVVGMLKSSDFDSDIERRDPAEEEKGGVETTEKREALDDDRTSKYVLKGLEIESKEEELPKLQSIDILTGKEAGDRASQEGPSGAKSQGVSDKLGDQESGETGHSPKPSSATLVQAPEPHSQGGQSKTTDYAGVAALESNGSEGVSEQLDDVIVQPHDVTPERDSSSVRETEENGVMSGTLSGSRGLFPQAGSDSNEGHVSEKTETKPGFGRSTGEDLVKASDINADFSDFHSDLESQVYDNSERTASEEEPKGNSEPDDKLSAPAQRRRRRGRASRRAVRRIFNRKGTLLFASELYKIKPQSRRRFFKELLKNLDFNDIEMLIGLAFEEKFARSESHKVRQAFKSQIPDKPLLGTQWIKREKSRSHSGNND